MDREPPHNDQTETAVLSAWVLQDKFACAWKPDAALFFNPTHFKIAKALEALDPRNRDETAICAELDRLGHLQAIGGPSAIVRVVKLTPQYGDPWPHVRALQEFAALRALLRELDRVSTIIVGEKDLGKTVQAIQEAVRAAASAVGVDVYSVADLLKTIAEDLLQHKPIIRFPTGVPSFDKFAGGLRPGQVTVLGATTNWGKSSFGVMVADESLRAGFRVLVVAFEDPPDMYGRRLLARRASVSAWGLREGQLADEEWTRVTTTSINAETTPFFLNAIGKSVERVCTDVRALCLSESIGLVIVDYLQAVQTSARKGDRRNEVTHVARLFSDTIKSSGASGLMFSQLRRGAAEEDRPTMYDLKESGDIENSAENVLIGFTKGGKPHIAVEKAKDGVRGGLYKLAWDSRSASFLGEASSDEPTEQRYP